MRCIAHKRGLAAAFGLLLAVVASVPCAASDANDLNTQGVEALERGEYAEAIAAFTAALEAEDNATVRHNLAIAYNNYGVSLLAGDAFDDATAALRKALEIEPRDEEILRNLARAYNSRGVALIEAANYQAAESYLLEAIRYLPSEATFRKNLAVAMTYRGKAYYEQRDDGRAFYMLREALQYDPANSAALMLLGEVCYRSQQLGWAVYYLSEAYKTDPEGLAGLEERIKRLQQEAAVENAFQRQDYGAFDIRYDGDLEAFDLEALRAHLSDAYYGVGGLLGYYPKQRVVVLVYTPEAFAKVRSVPDWVAGLYDGKIRVPALKDMKDEATHRLIRHEYTHAVVSELAGDRCAVWLNEGLAKYMEYHDAPGGMPTPLLRQRFRAGTLIPFGELQGDFVSIEGREKVALAYEEAYSIVRYIVDGYGMWKVKRMLSRYAQGEDTSSVLDGELYRTPARFEEDWLAWLKRVLK